MSTSQLPRRPWAQLPPPDGGLDDVRRTARVRRRRRTIAVAAVGSGVATTVTVLALLGGGGELNVLKTTVPPAVQPSPAASRDTSVTTPPAQPRAHFAQSGGADRQASGPHQSSGSAGAPVSGESTHHGSTSSNSPQLSRYRSRDTSTGGVHICGTQEYGDTSGYVVTSNWCLAAIAQQVSNGVRLTVNTCRDSTGGGVLTFPTTNEADITVQRNGKTVWDWARNHPARASSHTLSGAAGDCWNWTLVWPDITQSGASAGKGTFTFVATMYAKEFTAHSTDTTTFTV